MRKRKATPLTRVLRQQDSPKPAFERNEWYEALSRLKRAEPERFSRSISGATARALELYEQAKARGMKQAA